MIDNEYFDFAFSFAGEDRKIVVDISNQLKSFGINVFYDNDYQADLVGRDLYSLLRDVYKNKAKYVVCFISKNYINKEWTNLEFSAVKERMFTTFFDSDFLIPILLDDMDMPKDIPSYFGYYKHVSTDETASILREKFESYTNEDHLVFNINNFIGHLCEQIFNKIKHNKNVELIKPNQIVILNENYSKTYIFSRDIVSLIPNILINKVMNNSIDTDNFIMDSFPSSIITWKRGDDITFSIHEFDSMTVEPINNLSIAGVVNWLSKSIANS